jgi:hypothetical protein
MSDDKRGKQQSFVGVGDVLKKFKKEGKSQGLPAEYTRDKYISREFQKYGYDLAQELGDMKHKSLYIKLAKETPRGLLESAKSFVLDAKNAKNKGSLFMWKLNELKKTSKKTKGKK